MSLSAEPPRFEGSGLFVVSIAVWYFLQDVKSNINAFQQGSALTQPPARSALTVSSSCYSSGIDRGSSLCGGGASTPTRIKRLSLYHSMKASARPAGVEQVTQSNRPVHGVSLPTVASNEACNGRNPSEASHLSSSIPSKCAEHDDLASSVDVSDLVLLTTEATECEKRGDFVRAEMLYSSCVQQNIARLGDSHSDTISSRVDLAGIYVRQERFSEAEELLLSCMDKYQSLYGEAYPLVLVCMNDLAGLYDCHEKFDLAEATFLNCIAKMKDILGVAHPQTVATMNNLACLYERRERLEEASALYLDCIKRSLSDFADSHAATVTYIYNLAGLYETQLRFPEAEELYVSLLAKLKESIGNTSEDSLLCMCKLASLYQLQGKLDLAETLFLFCLAERRRVLCNYDMKIIKNMHSLAEVYASQYHNGLAEKMNMDAYNYLRERHGDAHADTLASLEILAIYYESIGDYTTAESYYERRLNGFKTLYGESSAITAAELVNFAEFQQVKEQNEFEIIDGTLL